MMRVWLVDDKRGEGKGGLELLLRQLEERPQAGVRLLGVSPFQPDFAAAMRKLVPDLLDLLVIHEPSWPDGPWTQEVFGLGLAAVVVTTAERAGRFGPWADEFPLAFVAPEVTAEGLWLALVAARAGRRREEASRAELERLNQRLQDRILIERAKGVLVHCLGISEDDAYRRLRVQSRRQRRQIREIAQSVLDAHVLLVEGSSPDGGRSALAEGLLASHGPGALAGPSGGLRQLSEVSAENVPAGKAAKEM